MNKHTVSISWKTLLKIVVAIFALFLGIYYWKSFTELLATVFSATAPVFIGFAAAYVINILMGFYERHYFKRLSHKKFVIKTRRPVCFAGALLTFVTVIALIIVLVVPELIECVKYIVSEIPLFILKLLNNEYVREIIPKEMLKELISIDWMSYVSKIFETLSSGIGNALGVVLNALTGAVSLIVTVFLSIIFSLYFLACKDKLGSQSKRILRNYFSEKLTKRILYTVSVFDESFHKYIVGQITEAVILGVLCTLGMLLFRFPNAPMIGALVGFTALIPVAGAYIGAGVGALIILTVSPVKALLFLVFIIVLQQLEGNLIYPKVVGGSVGLPALWVLVSVTVGGALGGIGGMLVAVPIAAALYRLVREDVERREAARVIKNETEEE